jgi:DNA invertase Pin-like site-specific DNA recombinase
MKIGYARVSSAGQNLETQVAALEAAGCERIFQEKRSGTSTDGRQELERALDALRPGDTLTVTRLDRLARSVGDLHRIVERIDAGGATFACLQQGGVDTTSSTGKLMLAILGAVAEFENDIRRDRQRDGIERAREKGVYQRRKAGKKIPEAKRRQVVELLDAGKLGPTEIASTVGIGRATVYRIEAEIRQERQDLEGVT